MEIKNLNISFGGIKAVQDISFSVYENELLGLIGPNGAGKTTVFNMITGFYCPDSGEIKFLDQSLLEQKPYKINKMGLARTFQNIRLFAKLSVLENVTIALQQREDLGWYESMFQTTSYLKKEASLKQRSLDLLKIFELDQLAEELATNLPYGKQRKLEIVRALACQPQLLILDEPAAGMNSSETDDLRELILFVKKKFNLTILLIEHDMKLVMNLCDRIVVLNQGQKIADGKPAEIKANEDVIVAYLGQRSRKAQL
jgi:branched-chain amino acid transport system ATP-binding protein